MVRDAQLSFQSVTKSIQVCTYIVLVTENVRRVATGLVLISSYFYLRPTGPAANAPKQEAGTGDTPPAGEEEEKKKQKRGILSNTGSRMVQNQLSQAD